MPAVFFALFLAAISSRQRPPDYIGDLRFAHGERGASVRHHAGATRMDFPRATGEVESEYQAGGGSPIVVTVTDQAGVVTLLWIREPESDQSAPEPEWVDLQQHRDLAGETCALQRHPIHARTLRCLTEDGVNLMPRREGRQLEMQSLRRAPVDDQLVQPPIELLDLSRWLSDANLAEDRRPPRRDYTARFESGTTIRRSGPWVSVAEESLGFPTIVVANENAGVEVRISGAARNDLLIRRHQPGKRFGPFSFAPSAMHGRETEVIFGEVCRWVSRSYTPDALLFECRTDDGAVLAIGSHGMFGPSWEAASSFRRAQVRIGAVLPEAKYFTPSYYGLAPARP